jgi:hypothetical protein
MCGLSDGRKLRLDDFCFQMMTGGAFVTVQITCSLRSYPLQHHARTALRARPRNRLFSRERGMKFVNVLKRHRSQLEAPHALPRAEAPSEDR